MTPYEAYIAYVALKNHFTKPSYDYFKYQGKIKSNPKSFDSRKDKVFFQKLAKHPDVINFLVANLSKNPKLWIRDLAYSEAAEATYQGWIKRNQAITYHVGSELNKLESNFNDNFLCHENQHPPLLRLFLSNEISLETFCILIDLTGCLKYWNEKMEYDPIWNDVAVKVSKYTPFIKIDVEKIKKVVLDRFSVGSVD